MKVIFSSGYLTGNWSIIREIRLKKGEISFSALFGNVSPEFFPQIFADQDADFAEIISDYLRINLRYQREWF